MELGASILNYIEYVKSYDENKPMKQNIKNIIVMSLVITLRSEDVIFRITKENGSLKQICKIIGIFYRNKSTE